VVSGAALLAVKIEKGAVFGLPRESLDTVPHVGVVLLLLQARK
jgi:hypothetical protein